MSNKANNTSKSKRPATELEEQEMVAAWKKEHGDVWEIASENYKCWVRKPTRREISFASTGTKDEILISERLLSYVWLGGDEVLKENDDFFYAVSAVLVDVIEKKKAVIKKL